MARIEISPALRAFGLLLLGAAAFGYIGTFRTAQFGPSWLYLGVASLFLLPFLLAAALCLLRLGIRWIVLGSLAWVAITLVAIEVHAQAQEASFKARYEQLPTSAEIVIEPRWWPFEGNSLIYHPAERVWGADC